MERPEDENVIVDEDGRPCIYAAAIEIRSRRRQLDEAYANFAGTIDAAKSLGELKDVTDIADILWDTLFEIPCSVCANVGMRMPDETWKYFQVPLDVLRVLAEDARREGRVISDG